VNPLDLAHRGERARRVGEDDLERQIERSPETLDRLAAKIAVIGHARRHQRVGDLHEDRGAAAEQRHRLAVHLPGGAAGAEQAAGRIERSAAEGAAQAAGVGGRKDRSSGRRGGHAGRWHALTAFCKSGRGGCSRFPSPSIGIALRGR
jgi:hypothetical protein